jgi:aryl-alcohol dehydrogenase-like predicted oxidoreductase
MKLSELRSKLILGSAQFGISYGINNSRGKVSEDEVARILDFAQENGIFRIDTAFGYGEAHKVLANYCRSNPRSKIEIYTKFYLGDRFEDLEPALVPFLKGISFHSFDDLSSPAYEETLGSLRRSFPNCAIGASVYTAEEVKLVTERQDLSFVQLPFNILDNAPEKQNAMTEARKKGMKLHVRSVFLQGLFFMDESVIEKRFSSILPYVRKIKSIAVKHRIPIEGLCMIFALGAPNVEGVILGVDSLTQLSVNVNSNENYSDAIFGEIWEFSSGLRLTEKETKLIDPRNW